eukprot:4786672-Prymnesium_polylepis.1
MVKKLLGRLQDAPKPDDGFGWSRGALGAGGMAGPGAGQKVLSDDRCANCDALTPPSPMHAQPGYLRTP